MKWTAALLLSGTFAVVTACAGPTGPDQESVSGFRPNLEDITVIEFDQAGAAVHYGGSHDVFGLALAEEIAAELRRLGHRAEAVPSGTTPQTPLVVSGRILRIDGGNRALRYFVSFGAGAAKLGAEGRLARSDGTELASFQRERWSGFGVFGGSSASLTQKCLHAVSSDIAKMINDGVYAK